MSSSFLSVPSPDLGTPRSTTRAPMAGGPLGSPPPPSHCSPATVARARSGQSAPLPCRTLAVTFRKIYSTDCIPSEGFAGTYGCDFVLRWRRALAAAGLPSHVTDPDRVPQRHAFNEPARQTTQALLQPAHIHPPIHPIRRPQSPYPPPSVEHPILLQPSAQQ